MLYLLDKYKYWGNQGMTRAISFVLFLIIICCFNPPAFAVKTEGLPECIVTTHCILTNWDVSNTEDTFNKLNKLIRDTPRTKIIDENHSYIHAEATTKWMHYVDDLEVKIISPKTIQLRSESRVGIGDMGVNKKRIDDLSYRLTTNQIN